MLEDMKMHSGRVLRRIIEEENEYGNGFRFKVQVEADAPLNKYVSIDLMYICEGEDTSDTLGVLLSPKAAQEIARALENASYTAYANNEETEQNG